MTLSFYKKANIFLIIIISCLFFFTLIGYPKSTGGDKDDEKQAEKVSHDISPIRYKENVFDTVYTEKKMIIEVLLDRQRVLLRKQGKPTDTLLCSTGNEFIKDAILTNRGIFIVKNKIPILLSKQFKNTKCLNWVGFNFGIGFHSLEKTGYYWSLGKRPSSHGCIRLSQEGAEKLFKEVEIETPIIIHKEDNARVIDFLPKNASYDTNYTRREIKQILKDRILLLYSQKYYTRKYPAIVLTHKYIGHSGIEIGDRRMVPKIQLYYPLLDIGIKNFLRPDRTGAYIFRPDSLNNIKYPAEDSGNVKHNF